MITKTNQKSTENQINLFSNTNKKSKIYRTSIFSVLKAHEKLFQIAKTIVDQNFLIETTFAEDPRTEEIPQNFLKIDQIVKRNKKNYSRFNSNRKKYSNYNRNRSYSNFRKRYCSKDRSRISKYN